MSYIYNYTHNNHSKYTCSKQEYHTLQKLLVVNKDIIIISFIRTRCESSQRYISKT